MTGESTKNWKRHINPRLNLPEICRDTGNEKWKIQLVVAGHFPVVWCVCAHLGALAASDRGGFFVETVRGSLLQLKSRPRPKR